ncbi:MAG: PLP-dependent aminotransferase family protein [Candidatus Pristimantibacillus sp.]
MEQSCRIRYERYYGETGRKAEALFLALRELIIDGLLNDGERLPASRNLAESFDMSRGSVNQAYDMLYAEGFVRSERGSGTFVAYRQPDIYSAQNTAGVQIALSSWAQRLQPVSKGGTAVMKPQDAVGIHFNAGLVDEGSFPLDEWKTVMFEQVRDAMKPEKGDDLSIEGHRPLREAIMHELRRERGIMADPDDIFITSGSMYAIALLSMLLIEPNDRVVAENPCYGGISRAIEAAGGVIIDGQVDDYGMIPEDWQAKLLFVTSSRQFPTGVQLSPERRTQLLEWASNRGAVIIEDDYDSEFRWGGRPAEPLKALDRDGRVIYVGTFSKTMYAGLRLGYAVVPESLREPMRRAKFLLEPHPSSIAEQRALATFMVSGQYTRHLRRQRRLYGRRLLRFREEAGRLLGGLFRFVPSDAGLHQFAYWIGDSADYDRLRLTCQSDGVSWSGGERFWREQEDLKLAQPTALFGFSHLNEDEITEGIQRIAKCWEKIKDNGSTPKWD